MTGSDRIHLQAAWQQNLFPACHHTWFSQKIISLHSAGVTASLGRFPRSIFIIGLLYFSGGFLSIALKYCHYHSCFCGEKLLRNQFLSSAPFLFCRIGLQDEALALDNIRNWIQVIDGDERFCLSESHVFSLMGFIVLREYSGYGTEEKRRRGSQKNRVGQPETKVDCFQLPDWAKQVRWMKQQNF